MRELDRENDGLFQRFLCSLQAGNVIPLDIGLISNDGALKARPQFLDLRICVVVALPAHFRSIDATARKQREYALLALASGPAVGHTVRTDGLPCSLLLALLNVLLQCLRSREVLVDLVPYELFGLLILLVYSFSSFLLHF